jgi:ATP-dependent Clp protease adaptor protein ClpS
VNADTDVHGSAPRSASRPVGCAVASDTETITVPDTVEELIGDEAVVGERAWIVVVWNDPVNLMRYVVYVFQKLFGFTREKATKLMLQVHNEGRAVVSTGTREKCEGDVARLHAHGLWATLQREDG